MLPVDMLGLSRIFLDNPVPLQTRIARVKSHVLQQLQIRSVGGRMVLMEVSGESFVYENSREWLISALTTEIQQDGEAVTSAVMRQPLGAGPVSCASFLPYSDHIVDCLRKERRQALHPSTVGKRTWHHSRRSNFLFR